VSLGHRDRIYLPRCPSRPSLGNLYPLHCSFWLITSHLKGGHLSYDAAHIAAVNAAVVAFEQNNADTRAAVVHGITGLPSGNGTFAAPVPAVQLFYDGPDLPEGMFADFFAIPTVSSTWAGPITFLTWSGTDGGVTNLRWAMVHISSQLF
jgi:hypothetical protein